jgi:anti-sigma regulatory factor (Ser/Thr protein kinase)
VLRIEGFIRGLRFLEAGQRDRLVIIASEILDNLISYSRGPRASAAIVRVWAGLNARMVFWFKSDSFADFAARERDSEKTYFDPRSRRYRGLGLAMCRRLAGSIRYRPGSLADAIIVRL